MSEKTKNLVTTAAVAIPVLVAGSIYYGTPFSTLASPPYSPLIMAALLLALYYSILANIKARQEKTKSTKTKTTKAKNATTHENHHHSSSPPNYDETQFLSIMCIEISGLNYMVGSSAQKDVLSNVKQTFNKIEQTIVENQGMIVKSFSDHLIAVFGFRVHGDKQQPEMNHADQAIQIAQLLQKQHVEDGINNKQQFFCPLKVGIFTGTTLIGEISEARSEHFFVAGETLGSCQKLMRFCVENMINISTATLELATSFQKQFELMRPKFIPVNYDNTLKEVIEINPFALTPPVLNAVTSLIRKQRSRFRTEPRKYLEQPLPMKSSMGEISIINFSPTGLAIRHNKYLGHGIALKIPFQDENKTTRFIVCETRWCIEEAPKVYLLGLKFQDRYLDDNQIFVKLLEKNHTSRIA